MTNNDEALYAKGYSTREVFEQREFEATQPIGSYFANALAFIVESMNDEHTMGDIESMDEETMMEFAEMYNFTPEALSQAIEKFRPAAYKLVDEE
jgi:hypothetical protein